MKTIAAWCKAGLGCVTIILGLYISTASARADFKNIHQSEVNRRCADAILRAATTASMISPEQDQNQRNIGVLEQLIASSQFNKEGVLLNYVKSIRDVHDYLFSLIIATKDEQSIDRSSCIKHTIDLNASASFVPGPPPTPVLPVGISGSGKWDYVKQLQERYFQRKERYFKQGFDYKAYVEKREKAADAYRQCVTAFYKSGFGIIPDRELCSETWDWRSSAMSTTFTLSLRRDGTFTAWMTPVWGAIYTGEGSWQLNGNLLTAKLETAVAAGWFGLEYKIPYPFVMFENRAVSIADVDTIILDGDKDNRMVRHNQ